MDGLRAAVSILVPVPLPGGLGRLGGRDRRAAPANAIAQVVVLWHVGQGRWMGCFFQASGSCPSWIRKDPNLGQNSHLSTYGGIRFRGEPIRHHGRGGG